MPRPGCGYGATSGCGRSESTGRGRAPIAPCRRPPHCPPSGCSRTARPRRSSGVYMVSSLHFFAIDVQRLHGGPVGHGEQDALAAGGVLVLVPVPGRHDEEVALLPREALALDLSDPIAAEGLIDRGAG